MPALNLIARYNLFLHYYKIMQLCKNARLANSIYNIIYITTQFRITKRYKINKETI